MIDNLEIIASFDMAYGLYSKQNNYIQRLMSN